MVQGVDRRDPGNPRNLQGQVTAVRAESSGEVLLELDTGDDLRLRDVTAVLS
jgi:hypothetical protein